MTKAKNYIDGVWTEAGDDGIPMFDPATGEQIGLAPRGTKDDIDRAVAAAKKAFPAWSQTPAPKRAEILFRCAQIMERRKDELSRLVTREMGKVKLEAEGDVQEAIDMAYYMAGEGRRLYGNTTPSELPNKVCMTFRSFDGDRLEISTAGGTSVDICINGDCSEHAVKDWWTKHVREFEDTSLDVPAPMLAAAE